MHDPMRSPSDSRESGEMGEAVTASLITDVLGGDLVYQHTPGDAPQGADLIYFEDDKLRNGEVKSVFEDWHQSNTAPTIDGRQMDDAWVADRTSRQGIEVVLEGVGDGVDQIGKDLYQVDFSGDTIARYEVGADGRREGATPEEIYSLSDVLDLHEAANRPEPESDDGLDDSETYEGEAGAAR